MTILESTIERDVCEEAALLGVTNVKLKAAGHRGYPDRMFLIPGGKPLFIEFKTPSGSLSKIQKVVIAQLKHRGYNVEVCNEFDTAMAVIKGCLCSS